MERGILWTAKKENKFLMDKELKALVWFGVALGFLMGFVTDLMFLFG